MADAVFEYVADSKPPSVWEQSLGIAETSTFELIGRVEAGLEPQTFERFSELSGVRREDLARFLGLSLRTVQRRKEADEPLDRASSEKLLRLAKLYARAALVIGSDELAKQWMQTPRALFGDKTPFAMASTELGAREVEDLLLRTEHGVFS